jgi:hypothetical protein
VNDLAKQYEWTRSWFEYTNGQTYNSNGWAIAAAFAIFIFVMKDAKDQLMVWFGVGAAVLLVVFAGLTAAGWAGERDAAYENLIQLEAGHWAIVSQDPAQPSQTLRTGSFGSCPLKWTIDALTLGIAAGFLVGGWLRLRSLPRRGTLGQSERSSEP